jgi:hypothetical protein
MVAMIGGILKKIGDAIVKLVDIVQKDMGVNLFFAVVIEVYRTLAQFCLPGDALDGDRFETLLEKKPPGRLQDGRLPILTFPFSSFFQSQDLSPSVSLNGLAPYHKAGNPKVTPTMKNPPQQKLLLLLPSL